MTVFIIEGNSITKITAEEAEYYLLLGYIIFPYKRMAKAYKLKNL